MKGVIVFIICLKIDHWRLKHSLTEQTKEQNNLIWIFCLRGIAIKIPDFFLPCLVHQPWQDCISHERPRQKVPMMDQPSLWKRHLAGIADIDILRRTEAHITWKSWYCWQLKHFGYQPGNS